MSYKFWQIGYGNMGKAIADSLNLAALAIELKIIDPNITENEDSGYYNKIDNLHKIAKPDLILFACKPQNIKSVIAEYKKFITPETIIISILAGVEIAYYKKYFSDHKIIRLMPNLGAKSRQSVNLLYADKLDEDIKELVTQICANFGYNIWLKEEAMLHIGTAVAGSGPAYYYNFLQIYSDYLIKSGFAEEEAKKIVILTAKAAIDNAAKADFSCLIKEVTSKGGTTEAALKILNQDQKLEELINLSLDGAATRSQKLGD